MKNISLFFFVVVFFTLTATFAFGQVQTIIPQRGSTQIKAFLGSAPGVLDPSKSEALKANVERMQKSSELGPGDHRRFLIVSNMSQYVAPGDLIHFTLVSLKESNEPLYSLAQCYKPGFDGDFDGTIPSIGYVPLAFNFSAGIRATHVGEQIPLDTRFINGDDLAGVYQYSYTFWNQSGELVQQIWIKLYVVNSGKYPKELYITKAKFTQSGIDLTGSFGIGSPMFFLAGSLQAGYAQSSSRVEEASYSKDGKTLQLPGRVGFERSTAQTIALLDAGTREATWVTAQDPE